MIIVTKFQLFHPLHVWRLIAWSFIVKKWKVQNVKNKLVWIIEHFFFSLSKEWIKSRFLFDGVYQSKNRWNFSEFHRKKEIHSDQKFTNFKSCAIKIGFRSWITNNLTMYLIIHVGIPKCPCFSKVILNQNPSNDVLSKLVGNWRNKSQMVLS